MRIDSITPEQTDRLGEWSKKWIAIGLSTEPADFDAAQEAALSAYKLCNLKRPMVILRMGSPYAATLGGAIAWSILRKLESQVGSQVWSELNGCIYNERGGQFWSAGWSAYVSFFRDVMGWNDPILERFSIDEALTKSCGWVWWHENVLAISDRPSEIHLDDTGRLHGEVGPSIAYRDGWSLYHWHGVSIPSEWITEKRITAAEALNWPNVEQRRAACEILGWARILKELSAKTINKDADPEIGELVEVNIPDSGKERFLRARCGTGREFAIPVPREVKTARQASAWTYGLDGNIKDYQPEVRT